MFASALVFLAAASAEAQVEVSDPNAAAIVADCSSRKFETRVEIEKDGQKRLTRMKLCAAANSDDAAWARTLKDARTKIAAHPHISEESKANIVAKLDAEIAVLSNGDSASKSVPIAPSAASGVVVPPAPPETVAPFLPRPGPGPATSVAAPRLKIDCYTPGQAGSGGPCFSLERDTLLTINAKDDLTAGTSLRFLRRGEVRREIAMTPLAKGKSIRLKLPDQLCAGVANSKVEIQILRSSKIIETLGPYPLRC